MGKSWLKTCGFFQTSARDLYYALEAHASKLGIWCLIGTDTWSLSLDPFLMLDQKTLWFETFDKIMFYLR